MTDAYLEHFGVKGMKWGKRKPDDAGPGPASKAARPSRSERRTAKKEARVARKAAKKEFYEKKAQNTIDEALKNPKSLIKTMGPDYQPLVMTGREFTMHMANGGMMDRYTTDVYAYYRGGQLELNANMNQRFRG